MKVYSQEEIDELIHCQKIIIVPPKKKVHLERGSYRNNMRLNSMDSKLEFIVFMRILEDFEEDFSIGLVYSPKDERESFCLIRCNGPHGEFIGGPESPHFSYHIHKARTENIEAGVRPERGGEVTSAYASYEEALAHFLKVVNISNASEFFHDINQLSLNFKNEG